MGSLRSLPTFIAPPALLCWSRLPGARHAGRVQQRPGNAAAWQGSRTHLQQEDSARGGTAGCPALSPQVGGPHLRLPGQHGHPRPAPPDAHHLRCGVSQLFASCLHMLARFPLLPVLQCKFPCDGWPLSPLRRLLPSLVVAALCWCAEPPGAPCRELQPILCQERASAQQR